jgi:phage baseplate assembly protein W
MALYKGFSSYNYQTNKTFSVTDIELVKFDLLNHIFTRRGERVMHPNFGTRIPDITFEPLDSITLSILEEDLRSVIAFDPRVELVRLNVIPYYDLNTAIVQIEVLYVELNMQGTLDLNISFSNG